IDSALKRIDEGTFGRCEECGKDIAAGRLQALPYARYCIDCSRRLQGTKLEEMRRAARWGQKQGPGRAPPPEKRTTHEPAGRESVAGKRKGGRPPAQVEVEGNQPIPPGATLRALDNDVPYDQTSGYSPGEEDAAGTPGGGTEVGGLAGTNVGDGAPENAHLEE